MQQPLQDGTDPDPYVKLYLLPDPQKTSKRKTKAARRTCNPTYNEMVQTVLPVRYMSFLILFLSFLISSLFLLSHFPFIFHLSPPCSFLPFLTYLSSPLPPPDSVSPAGVWADPSGGPGPEGDPPAGSWWRGFLGEHPAGRDPHPSEKACPRSALGGLAPAGCCRLRPRPLTDKEQEAVDLKEEKKRTRSLRRAEQKRKILSK